jgi:hypothetical protein
VLSKLKLGNLIEDMPKILVSIKIFYFFENEFNGYATRNNGGYTKKKRVL